jgi:KaiC/GvpD/RAD55 family RecA-like ATPase
MQLFQKLGSCGAAIVLGPPLSGKESIIQGFVSSGLAKDEPVLFITTDKSSEELKKELLAKKIYYGGRMKFIDCYSKQTNELCKDTDDTKRVSGPLALNEISIALSDAEVEFIKKNPKHKVVFDSLSTVLMYTNPQTVGRFAQVLVARIKKAGGSVLFSLEEGMHEPGAIVTIEHLMDCIIEVKKEKGKIFVKARGIDGFDDWKELKG